MATKRKNAPTQDHGTGAEPKPTTYASPEDMAKARRTRKPINFMPAETAKAVGRETKLASLLVALAQGVTVEQLVEVLSRSGSAADQSVARSWLTYDVKRLGYGVREEDQHFFLVFPEGMTEVVFKDAKVETPAVVPEAVNEPKVKIAAKKPPKSKKSRKAAV